MHLSDTDLKIKISTECFILYKEEILLFKRSSESRMFPNFWTAPGGHVDFGEDILTACIREVHEEAGIKVNPTETKLKYIALHNHLDRKEIWSIYGFVVNAAKRDDIKVDTHEGEAKWIDIKKLDEMDIFPPVKYYLDHVINKKSGLLYSWSEWENAKLVKVLKETKDLDY